MTLPSVSKFIAPATLQSLGCPYKPGENNADAWTEGFYAAVKFYGLEEEEPLTEQDKKEFIDGLRGAKV